MGIDKSSFMPLYYQIANNLRRDIKKGKYQPNTALPSEYQLMAQYGVSRGTVRDAIKMLLAEGLVTRQRGRGSFVTSPKIEQSLLKLLSFTELMQSQGKTPSAKVIVSKVLHSPSDDTEKSKMAEVAHALRLSLQERILFIERLRLGDEEPLVIERSYFPASMLEALLEYDIEHESIYTIMENELDIKLGHAEQSIEAKVSDNIESEILQISPGSPMLLIKRLAYAVAGEPVEYAEDLYRADRLKLRISTKRSLPHSRESDSESLHMIKPDLQG